MKKLFLFGIFLLLFSCEPDITSNKRETRIWVPDPSGIIGDGKVELYWFNNILMN